MKNNLKISGRHKFTAWDLRFKILLILSALACGASSVAAQRASTGKLGNWTFGKVSSREKDDEILPVSYKMRVSKNKGFDRIVFEFAEREVPEYAVYYTKPPVTLDANHLENPAKPAQDEIIQINGKAFILITFALSFEVTKTGAKFPAEQFFPVLQDFQPVDWFENSFTFAAGLKAKKAFRVQELSNPARLVVDFKH